jgi:hypothetical protein
MSAPEIITKKRKSSSKSADVIENLNPDEITSRKGFVKAHRLLPNILQVITETKREGMLPAVTLNVRFDWYFSHIL